MKTANKSALAAILLIFSLHLNLYAEQKNTTQKVKVGYFYSNNFQEGCSDSSIKTGYSYEYMQYVSGYTGWTYEYVYGDWSDLMVMLENGEIDIMSGISFTPERSLKISYPDYAEGVESYYIYKLASDKRINTLASLQNCRIGTIKGNLVSSSFNEWRRKNNIACTEIQFNDFQKRDQALNLGIIDALVTTDNNVTVDSNLFPITKISESSYYLAVSKTRPDLLAELNQALTKIHETSPYFVSNLQNKYFSLSRVNANLSEEETEWLNNHKSLRIGFMKDLMPYCGEKNSDVTGLISIVPQKIFELESLQNDIQLSYNSYDSFEQMTDALHEGEVDVIFPICDSMWHAEKLNVLKSEPIVTAVINLIYNGEYNDSITKKIAVYSNSPIQKPYVELYYPESECIFYKSEPDCLEAILKGEAGCAVFTSFRARNYLSNFSYRKLQSVQLPQNSSYCFGVAYENSALLRILNRGISMLDSNSTEEAMYSFATLENFSTPLDFFVNNLVLFLVLILILMIGISVLSICISKQKERVTAEKIENERVQNNQLSIVSALSRDYLNIFTVDVQDKTCEIIKLNGYVTEGFDKTKKQKYPYTAMCNQYIADRVYSEDVNKMFNALDLDNVLKKLSQSEEYITSYRVMDKGEIHYYQSTFLRLNGDNDKTIIAGFQNIDAIVKEANEKENLKHLSETDLLTQVLNRGCGENRVREMISLSQRGMFCLLDIDKFKIFNDTYGHIAGDKVLIGISEALKHTFRDKDVIFRLGGDEFAVFVPNILTRDRGDLIIKRFFALLEKLDISELKSSKVTVSIGAVIYSGVAAQNFDSLYKFADANLYESKNLPGNTITYSEI